MADTEQKDTTAAPVQEQSATTSEQSATEQPTTEQPVAEAPKEIVEEVKAPDLRPGMTIRVHQKIKEGDKERIQVFQGMIIALRGKTPATKTMTVQKESFGVRVDKIFPLASPLIAKIEIVKQAHVRRSKLYFLKDYTKRLKETFVKA